MMKRWARLLRSRGLRGAEFFPHLTSEALPVSRERSTAAGILTVIILTVLGLLIFATAIVAQFSTLKTQIAGLKSELAGIQGKLVNFEGAVVATSPHRTETNHSATASQLTRASGPPEVPFALSRDDIQLVRDFIKIAPPPVGAAAKIRLGDILPDFALTPIPEPITDKLPKLKGARFTIDRNGATVVVSPGTNRVDVIINPR